MGDRRRQGSPPDAEQHQIGVETSDASIEPAIEAPAAGNGVQPLLVDLRQSGSLRANEVQDQGRLPIRAILTSRRRRRRSEHHQLDPGCQPSRHGLGGARHQRLPGSG